MQVIKTMKPDARGAQRFRKKWGDTLVAVRYRRDEKTQKRYTTIELIVDESFFSQPELTKELLIIQNPIVAIQIKYEESVLRTKLKKCGAKWSAELQLWLVRYKPIASLSLEERIVQGAIEKCTDVDLRRI